MVWPFSDEEEEVIDDTPISEFSAVARDISTQAETVDQGLAALRDAYQSYGFDEESGADEIFQDYSTQTRKRFGQTQAFDYDTTLEYAPVDIIDVIGEGDTPEDRQLDSIDKWETENLRLIGESRDPVMMQSASQLTRGIQELAVAERRKFYGADNYLVTDQALRLAQGAVGPIASLVGADGVNDWFQEHTDPDGASVFGVNVGGDDSYWSAISSGLGSGGAALAAGIATGGAGAVGYLAASGAGAIREQVEQALENEATVGEAIAAGGIEAVSQAGQVFVGGKVFGGAAKRILGKAAEPLGARVVPRVVGTGLLEGGAESGGQVLSNVGENIGASQDPFENPFRGAGLAFVGGFGAGSAAAGLAERYGKAPKTEPSDEGGTPESGPRTEPPIPPSSETLKSTEVVDIGDTPPPKPSTDVVPDSVLASFVDMPVSESGIIDVSTRSGFSEAEVKALNDAGLVDDYTTPEGKVYQGVRAEDLWEIRDARRVAATKKAPASESKEAVLSAEERSASPVRAEQQELFALASKIEEADGSPPPPRETAREPYRSIKPPPDLQPIHTLEDGSGVLTDGDSVYYQTSNRTLEQFERMFHVEQSVAETLRKELEGHAPDGVRPILNVDGDKLVLENEFAGSDLRTGKRKTGGKKVVVATKNEAGPGTVPVFVNQMRTHSGKRVPKFFIAPSKVKETDSAGAAHLTEFWKGTKEKKAARDVRRALGPDAAEQAGLSVVSNNPLRRYGRVTEDGRVEYPTERYFTRKRTPMEGDSPARRFINETGLLETTEHLIKKYRGNDVVPPADDLAVSKLLRKEAYDNVMLAQAENNAEALPGLMSFLGDVVAIHSEMAHRAGTALGELSNSGIDNRLAVFDADNFMEAFRQMQDEFGQGVTFETLAKDVETTNIAVAAAEKDADIATKEIAHNESLIQGIEDTARRDRIEKPLADQQKILRDLEDKHAIAIEQAKNNLTEVQRAYADNIEELEKELAAARNEVNELSKRPLEPTPQQIEAEAKAKKKLADLTIEVQKQKDRIRHAEDNYALAQSEAEEANIKVEELNDKLREAEEGKTELEAEKNEEIKALEKSLREEEKENSSHEKAIKSAHEKITEHEATIKQGKTLHAKSTKEVEKLSRQLEKAEEKLDIAKEKEAKTLEEKREQRRAKEAVDQLRKQKAAEEKKLTSIQEKEENALESIKTLKKDAKDTAGKLEKTTKQLEKTKEKVAKAKEALKAQTDKQKSNKEAAKKVQAGIKEKIIAAKKTLASKQADIKKAERAKTAAENGLKEIREQTKETQKKLNELTQAVAARAKQKQEPTPRQTKQISILEERLKKLREDFTAVKGQDPKTSKRVQPIKQDIDTTKKNIEYLEGKRKKPVDLTEQEAKRKAKLEERNKALEEAREKGTVDVPPEAKAKIISAKKAQQRAKERLTRAEKIFEEKMNQIPSDVREKLRAFYELHEKLPPGDYRQQIASRIFDIEARHIGRDSLDRIDVLFDYWRRNVLSGPVTQLRNLVGNTSNLASGVTSLGVTSAIKVAKDDLAGAGDFTTYLTGMKTGFGRGWTQAKEILNGERGGRAKFDFEGVPTQPNKMTYYNFINESMSRLLSAVDAVFYRTAMEGQAHLVEYIASEKVKEVSNSDGSVSYEPRGENDAPMTVRQRKRYVQNALFNTDAKLKEIREQLDAEEALLKEAGITVTPMERKLAEFERAELMRDERVRLISNRHAERAVFQQEPEGLIGVTANAITAWSAEAVPITINYKGKEHTFHPFRFMAAFMRTAANVSNSFLDHTPVGFARARKMSTSMPSLEGMNFTESLAQLTKEEKAAFGKDGKFRGKGTGKNINTQEALTRLRKQAEKLDTEGRNLVTEGKVEEAQAKFDEAKSKLRDANDIRQATKGLEARQLAGQALIGTSLIAGFFGWAFAHKDDEDPYFAFYGSAPPGKWKEWQEKGIPEYSMKIGDTYVGLQYTPLALLPAIMAPAIDSIKKGGDPLMLIGNIVTSSYGAAANLSFLKPLGDLYKGISELKDTSSNESTKKEMAAYNQLKSQSANYLKGFIPSVGFLQNVGRWMEAEPVETYNNFTAKMLGQMPFAREMGIHQPQLNMFGEPMSRTLWERATGGSFLSSKNTDPLLLWMTETGYSVTNPGPVYKLTPTEEKKYGALQEAVTGYQDVLDEEQSREVLKISGPLIKAKLYELSQRAEFATFSEKSQKKLNEEVSKIRAKAKLTVLTGGR